MDTVAGGRNAGLRFATVGLAGCMLLPIVAAGQQGGGDPRATSLEGVLATEGTAREVPARVAEAVRSIGPITLDGSLDEPAWQEAPAIRDFRQIEPVQGADPFVETEVRILFDEVNLYIGVEVRDPEGAGGIRVSEMRRNFGYFQNDLVGVALDGFGDGRSAMAFQVNPLGALRDLRVYDGQFFDREWQGVWDARTRIHEGGWSAEIRVPWSTLRYDPEAESWRILLVRRSRRLNEEVGWPEWPRQNNAYTMRYAAPLEGLAPPPPARNLELQPYLTARTEGDPRRGTLGENRTGEAGGELKWAVTPNTVLDLTVNTDFAEADVDRQVVNLTRFSVFFPEQRPFFLENAGLFRLTDGPWIEPFFSRRIGLAPDGTPLRILGGARVTSQTPSRSAGALLIHQEGAAGLDGSSFGVARWQQNLGSDHRVGGLLVARADEVEGGDRRWNTVGAADWYLRFGEQGFFRGMVSGSVDGLTDETGGAAFLWGANRASWGYVGWIQRYISPGYRPRTGFVPRTDLLTTSPATNLDLRPDWLPEGVLALRPALTVFAHHRASDLSFQEGFVRVRPLVVAFRDGGELFAQWEGHRQDLASPFGPLPGLEVASGSYRYDRYGVSYATDPSASLSGALEWLGGGFFDGTLHQVRGSLRAVPSPHLSAGVTFERNRITDLGPEERSATTYLVGPELRAALNPRTQLYAFYQHNTAAGQGTLNARFSWEFAPLSFLHLVVNDGRPVTSDLFPDREAVAPHQRQFLLKVSYLWGL